MMAHMGEGFETNRLKSRMREAEYDTASGDDDPEAGDKNSKKKKKYNRHTPYQIQELEAFFKVNQHPEEKDRLELGRRLSLDSRQVKFWFQNRRTQMKTQVERHENSILRRQNEDLLLENLRMKEVLRNPACTNCGGPAILGDCSIEEQHLRIENSRLRDEINRMSALAERFLGRPVSSLVGPSHTPYDISNSSSLELAMGTNGLMMNNTTSLDNKEMVVVPSDPSLLSPTNNPFGKSIYLELAEKALDELVKLVQVDDPLWIRNGTRGIETLNLQEYARLAPPCLGIKPEGYLTNATRTSDTVVTSSMSIAETLMDGNHWVDMFPCIIGKTTIIDIIQRGPSSCTINGCLQVMYAELQGLSPLIPVRSLKFLRFCRQLAEGVWVVVDMSVDSLEGSESHAFFNCKRLPSGCVIQDMANGCSKVTWVEHLEYKENGMLHPLLGSGISSCFGADRWLASLQRQSRCIEILTLSPINTEEHQHQHHYSGNVMIPPAGKKSMINLAHRMTRSFCYGVCSTVHPWQLVQVSNMGEESRLTIRNNNGHDPGEPSGVVLSATTSVWMPVSHQCLFEFLGSEQLRSEWDELAYDRPMQEMARVNKSNDGLNCISILRPTVANLNNQNAMIILQETQTDSSGSVIVYAAVDIQAMQRVMDGGESVSVAILPSGFAIIPNDAKEGSHDGGGGGGGSCCLMTVGFQILVNSPENAKLTVESVETVNTLMFRRIQRIKSALGCE